MEIENVQVRTYMAVSVALQLGFMVVVPLGGFILLGYSLDKWLGSSPVILLVGVVTGFVVTAIAVYDLIKPLIEVAIYSLFNE